MRTNTISRVTLALAAILVHAGCNNVDAPSVANGKTTGDRGGGSGIFGTTKVTPKPVTLPEGTPLAVRTTTALSTNTHQVGQTFTAHLDQPLILDGREIAPRGAQVEGTITGSDNGGRVKGRASLAVQVTRLHTTGGQVVEISTGSITRVANATKKEDAVKVGVGSGVGAAIGAIAGGGRGAAIGAAAGAGAGAGVVLATHGAAAVIPSETVLHFVLRFPVTIAASR